MSRLSLLLLALSLWMGAACQSGPEVRSDESGTQAASAGGTSARALLDEAERDLDKLQAETEQLSTRVGSALSAVNWNLMRYPQCVDQLFQTAAELDLGQQQLLDEQAALRERLASLRAAQERGEADLAEITALKNRIQHAQDRVTILNAELAMLFSRTMRRESPCPDTAGA